MKPIRRFLSFILPVSATTLTLTMTGCSDYDNGFTEKEIEYQRNFRELFGDIDPNQDWNMATRGTVMVNTSKSSNIKIYAFDGVNYSIVGDYEDVSGSQTLGFDVVKGTTKILVSDGTTGYKTFVGGSVSFDGTRAAHVGTTDVVTVGKGEYINLTEAEAEAYRTVLPEINAQLNDYDQTNLPKVTKNFKFVSNGRFSFYPFYWQTSQADEIGVYYTDGSGYHEVPVYTIKSGSEHLNVLKTTSSYNLSTNSADAWNADGVTEEQYINYLLSTKNGQTLKDGSNQTYYVFNDGGNIYAYYPGNFTPSVWTTDYNDNPTISSYAAITANQTASVHGSASTEALTSSPAAALQQLSQEITIDIPEGTEFGFYLLHPSGYKFYSEASKNPKYTQFGTTYASQHACYASSIIIGGEKYLCFEDWLNGDFDLNDVVFKFAGNVPTVIDHDATSSTWVIQCEDLGSTFDTDFNDVVFRVEHVAGRYNATITPLAAGGTLASYLFYDYPAWGTGENATAAGEQRLGEIHSFFGQSGQASGEYTPVNVGASRGLAGAQISISVPKEWTLTYHEADNFDKTQQYWKDYCNMGGFVVKVLPEGEAAGSTNFGNASVIAAPAVGNVPEMICVPEQFTLVRHEGSKYYLDKYAYAWSQELESLSDSYATAGHLFSGWVSDYSSSHKDWYKYPSGATVARHLISSVECDENGVVAGGDEEEFDLSNIAGESLTFTTPTGFTYESTTYQNGSLIDFSGVTNPDNATATLYVEFARVPGAQTLYVDYKDATQYKVDRVYGGQLYAIYDLTAEQLNKAISTGGLYIVASKNGDVEPAVTVSGAKLVISGKDYSGGSGGGNTYGTKITVTYNSTDYTFEANVSDIVTALGGNLSDDTSITFTYEDAGSSPVSGEPAFKGYSNSWTSIGTCSTFSSGISTITTTYGTIKSYDKVGITGFTWTTDSSNVNLYVK